MSYTPCPECDSPLEGREGSRCTNDACPSLAERVVSSHAQFVERYGPIPQDSFMRFEAEALKQARRETAAAAVRKRARKAQRAARRRNR